MNVLLIKSHVNIRIEALEQKSQGAQNIANALAESDNMLAKSHSIEC